MTTNAYHGKLAVVTGAGGFIGSHLVEALVGAGARVRALVRYTSTGARGHLDELAPEVIAKVETVAGNIEDGALVRRLVDGADVVFHLAALIGIPYSYVAPQQYVSTNVQGTLNVLQAVQSLRVPRMVHTSTSETYGTARYTPIDEAHPLQGQSPYSATKIAADKLAESFHLSFGVPVATIRPFNTFGPRQSSRAIVPSILKQLAARKTELRVGSLTPVRDLSFVRDTVAGFLAVGLSDRCVGETVNVGSGRAVSIGQLCELAFQVTGRRAHLVVDPARLRPDTSEVMVLLADSAKAAGLCGHIPRVSLEDGLAETWRYVQDHLHRYRVDDYDV